MVHREMTSSSRLFLQAVGEALRRPYRVTPSMVILVLLVPFYIFIPTLLLPGRTLHAPALPLDDLVPLSPAWAPAYGALYLFLILLPVLAIRDEEHIRRTVLAYLLVWGTAYVCFLVYPTAAPRPIELAGNSFGVWGLRLLYGADPPYNCFPSLHVAHSFVSAFTCDRLHRPVGVISGVAASLVAVSTLFTKQHYVLDVAAGILLASIAYLVFLRGYSPPASMTRLDRQVATAFAAGLLGILGCVVAGLWVLHPWFAG